MVALLWMVRVEVEVGVKKDGGGWRAINPSVVYAGILARPLATR